MKFTEGRYGEFVCEHGVGHPSLKRTLSMAKIQMIPVDREINEQLCKRQLDVCSIHGCDDCCSRDDFPGKYTQDEYNDAVTTLLNFYKTKRDAK